MKRRKPGGTPKSHAPKTVQLAMRKPVPADIVPAMMEQTARNEIKARIDARKRPPVQKTSSKQPAPSDEMKAVTEIGSRRWKSGQTK
jgi:hypothetical protein